MQGVSTRKVKAVTETLCGHSFSASSTSAICPGMSGQELYRRPVSSSMVIPSILITSDLDPVIGLPH